ncbi:helix-turn-helix domain-containing protein [Mycolicibacterium frederiksbergense]|uniref:DNA-binding protein n=1 Tax=Mycolicibacterium frederiksbergense TaxID=117567 RepID=A0A6H0RXK6_9MYCO|nr:helix-turn-helix domain-containing protein [Mycolicibacterium frederiksbergense]QIV79674.1 DNA-binding protein [Mycolicibacterium frederiksbergense]
MSEVLTTGQVARRLGVHPSRVRALIAAGRLTATRAGDQWLVDADSVDRHADLVSAGATGRPFATRTAWAAAAMCDGLSDGLAASERYRLRNRLARAADTPAICQTVQRWMSLRARAVRRYRVGARDVPDLLASGGVLPTGISAADSYSLGLAAGGAADAYVSTETAQRLVADFYLIGSPQGNLTLRILDIHALTATQIAERGAGGMTFTIHTAPRLIAGADLADDSDARTRAAGCALINDALSATKRADR